MPKAAASAPAATSSPSPRAQPGPWRGGPGLLLPGISDEPPHVHLPQARGRVHGRHHDGRRRRHLLPVQVPDRDRAHRLRHAGDLDRPVPRRRRRPLSLAPARPDPAIPGADRRPARRRRVCRARPRHPLHPVRAAGGGEAPADRGARACRGDPARRPASSRRRRGSSRITRSSTAASPPTGSRTSSPPRGGRLRMGAEGAGDAAHQIADRLQGLAAPARREPDAVPLPRRDAAGIWHRRAHVPPSRLHRGRPRPADRQGQCAAAGTRRRRKESPTR